MLQWSWIERLPRAMYLRKKLQMESLQSMTSGLLLGCDLPPLCMEILGHIRGIFNERVEVMTNLRDGAGSIDIIPLTLRSLDSPTYSGGILVGTFLAVIVPRQNYSG